MGTPEFAVPSLDILVKNNFEVIAVITAPDKPAGRGRKISQSAIKKYALENSIRVLQPTNLKDPEFIDELKQINADLQVVVAFRMLPKVIWSMPKHGTFNLHASLLPQYRGAAPINWAIINGESETGITTFFLNEEIDTGRILFQQKVSISENMTAGALHDKLMLEGSELVLKTVKSISSGEYKLSDQTNLISKNSKLKSAPKIFKNDTRINWNKSSKSILNLINGLSPYPGAFTLINSATLDPIQLKIYEAEIISGDHKFKIGQIICDGKNKMEVACADGLLQLRDVQMAGKKRIKTADFLRGFSIKEGWIAQ
jgi:methionyl-tRNA formyltransferase